MDGLNSIAALDESQLLEKVTDFAHSLNTSNETSVTERLPDFPVENLKAIARIIKTNPTVSAFDLVHRLYPFDVFLPKDSQRGLRTLFDSLQISVPEASADGTFLSKWTKKSNRSEQKIVSVKGADEAHTTQNEPQHIGTSDLFNSLRKTIFISHLLSSMNSTLFSYD